MPKGGDTTTTNTSSSIPSQLLPYYQDLLGRAQQVSNQPYQPYNNQRLAGFSTDTQNAFQSIRDMAASGGGQGAVGAGINAATGVSGFQPDQVTTQAFPGTDISGYMSPYLSNVLDVQKQRANQDFQEQQAGRDAAAVQAGAFGGDRRFVQNSLAQRDLNQQLQSIDAAGLNTAFNNATNLWTADQSRALQAAQGNQTAGLNAANTRLNAASTLGQLGQTRNQLGLDNAQALSSVGAKIQQQQQAGLDQAYNDFVAQRDWPSKQLSLYSQLLSGTPVSDKSTATTTPAPDFLSQLVGLGTSGLGLAKLLGIGG